MPLLFSKPLPMKGYYARLVTTLLLVLLAACGGGGDPVTPTPTPPPPPPPPPPPVTDPAPTASAVSPATVTVGTNGITITVTGTGFVARSTVNWNGAPRPTTVVSATQLTAAIPAQDLASTGSASVTVVTAAPGGGTSAALKVDIHNPLPNILQIAPASFVAGSSDTTLTVIASGIVDGSVILWNETERPTTRPNDSTLTAALSVADISSTGSAKINIRNPQPGGGTSTDTTITIVNPIPRITSVVPANIQAGSNTTSISVIGSQLTDGSTIYWNGTARPSTRSNDSTIVATISAEDIAAPGSINITASNPAPGGGISVDTLVLTITVPDNPKPTLSSLAPQSVVAGSGPFTLTILGSDFLSSSQVHWNNNVRASTFVNESTIQVAVNASDITSAGSISIYVSTPAPGGGHSDTLQLDIIEPMKIDGDRRLFINQTFACGIEDNNRAKCWGDGTNYYLGDGSTTSRSIAAPVSGMHSFVTIAGTSQHICAVSQQNALWCWGIFANSPLSISPAPVPALIGTPEPVIGVSMASFARSYCILGVSGAAYCRGTENTYGELGRGSAGTNTAAFVPVTGGHRFVAITMGRSHACGLKSDGEAWCWGKQDRIGATTGSSANHAPVKVEGGQKFAKINANENHTCALTQTGEAWCWGSNNLGSLGHSSFSTLPNRVNTSTRFIDIAAGLSHSCAVSVSNDVWCWGNGNDGRLGLGDELSRSTPERINAGGTRFVTVAAGMSSTCARDVGGNTWCWGAERDGVLGNMNDWTVSTAQQVPGLNQIEQISLTAYRACARSENGDVWCWGINTATGPDAGLWQTAISPTPVKLQSNVPFAQISTGGYHSCGLEADGTPWCWGNGATGRLGNGSTSSSEVPVRVSGDHKFTRIAAGERHSCGLANDGIWCWGTGTDGQLGNGNSQHSYEPVLVGATNGFQDVAAGTTHTCAVAGDGRVFCWGHDFYGALGKGSSGGSPVPIATATAERFTRVYAGEGSTCALRADGAAFCWGLNLGGRRGFPAGVPQNPGNSPTALPTGVRFSSIDPGGVLFGCGLSGSSFYCWGSDTYGELASGRKDRRIDVPITSIPSLANIRQFSLGYYNACGIDGNKQVLCWGRPYYGLLGDGRRGIQARPVLVRHAS